MPKQAEPDLPSEAVLSFSAGEHHTAHETQVPQGAARRVVNFDLHDSGYAVTRPTLGTLPTVTGGSWIWQAPTLGMILLVSQGRLARFNSQLSTLETLTDNDGNPRRVSAEAPVYWAEHNEVVYWTNGTVHGTVTPDGTLHDWWVENPVAGNRSSNGERVRYLTYEDEAGRESGAVRFDVGTPPVIPGRVARLYWADEGSTQYRRNGTGRALQTQGRVVMPPGRYLQFYAGRAFVARGPWLYYSDPLNPGLCDLRYNWEEFPAPITMVAAAQSGLYVSTAEAVYFLAGANPGEWTRRSVLQTGALPGSATHVPADVLSSELIPNSPESQYVVAFLTRSGVALALDGGNVVEPTSDRLRLPADTEVRMSLVPRDGYYQLIAIPQHPVRPVMARAIDSPVTTKEEL